jgi:hypothetical protein
VGGGNENDEPIHVHIGVTIPSANATKVWLTKSGGCVVANNRSRIPQKDLVYLLQMIQNDYSVICNKWKTFFGYISYYC